MGGRYVSDFEQCVNEIAAYLNFNHPNLISLKTIINTENKVYVVQELGEQTLLQWNSETSLFEGEPFRKSYVYDIAKGNLRIQEQNIFTIVDLFILI